MKFLLLTLLFWTLNFLPGRLTLVHPPSSPTEISKSIVADSIKVSNAESGATNIIFQSKDGGRTWQDISQGLPENRQPEDFFAGESEVYWRFKNELYRSKSNLETPLWEKENAPDPRGTSIAFNRSGVMAYNSYGQMFQKISPAGTWLPIYTNFEEQSVESIFESSDGSVFLGSRNGLYKSTDKGRIWKQVHSESLGEIVESEGVLIATSQNGIMRSADNGERWEWVIREGGVGIDVERVNGGFAAVSYSASTETRRIRISMDGGKTWKAIDDGLQSLSISSIKQIGNYLLCGHPDGIFRSSDMGKTWSMVHPGVDSAFKIDIGNIVHPTGDSVFVDSKTTNSLSGEGRKVFKIYVSGNVLYAVARPFGC